jgi:glycosyltransferase involved in cell wall biosynthesis
MVTGDQTNLVIAGKQGWKAEPFVHRLQTHSEMRKRLHWLNSPNDELLSALYSSCSALIMASTGEGFGLPLIEATYFSKPMLVRDIPVCREIVGDAASYLSGTGRDSLTQVLPEWLKKVAANDHGPVTHPICVRWQESSAN